MTEDIFQSKKVEYCKSTSDDGTVWNIDVREPLTRDELLQLFVTMLDDPVHGVVTKQRIAGREEIKAEVAGL